MLAFDLSITLLNTLQVCGGVVSGKGESVRGWQVRGEGCLD